MTTLEPGARLDFTHGLRSRPRSTAFFASSPAAIITDGLDVFVQLVIAAITTEPCSSSKVSPSISTSTLAGCGASATATAGISICPVPSTGSWPGACSATGSLAGNVSATPASCALP